MKTICTLLIAAIVFTSCSKDDSTPIKAPQVTYNFSSIEATFFTEGNSTAPTVNWNGDIGNFSLAIPIEGLSINANTGVLSWTKLLPPKNHNVQVIATNSAGNTSLEITLNNPLQGVFTGTHSGNAFFELNFNENGSVTVKANSETNPDTASGTYTITDNIIITNYIYDSGLAAGQSFSVKGTLTQTQTKASYTGNWYYGHDALDTNLGKRVELEMN